MLLRSCLSWATVRPRYSVSRTAFEFSNDFVSSATVASFCAMVTPYVYGRHADAGRHPRLPHDMEKAPAQAHGASEKKFAHLRGPLRCSASIASRFRA